MLLLNFGHAVTDEQMARIRELTGQDVERIIPVPTYFDHSHPFNEQVRDLLATVPLTSEQWQTTPMIINPPSLAPITADLVAEIHGRSGDSPTITRLHPIAGIVPPTSQIEIADLLNHQSVRDVARSRRLDDSEVGSCCFKNNEIDWSPKPVRRRRGRS